MNDNDKFTTSDISLASFLLMKNLLLLSAVRVKGRFEFTFDNKLNDTQTFCQEYLMSDYPRYDAALRQLKKRLYGL